MGKTFDADSVLFNIRCMSIAFGLLGVACTTLGIFTLYYAAPDIRFPFATGSGIWTGVIALATSIVGIKIVRNYSDIDPTSVRSKVVAYYTLIIFCVTCAILNLSYSAVGLSYCYSEMRIGQIQCNAEERPRLILMEGFSIAFSTVLVILSIVSTVYLSVGRKMNNLAGHSGSDATVLGTCCYGNCVCYSGTYGT